MAFRWTENPLPVTCASYIQGLLADLGLPVTYEEVYERYQKDVEKGMHFRVTPND
jgi:hypothetical protein